MIKTLARSIREYKKTSILKPILVTVEVILECIIPFTIANLVNQMQAGCLYIDRGPENRGRLTLFQSGGGQKI